MEIKRYYDPLQFDVPAPLNTTGTGTLSDANRTYYNKNLIKLAGPYLVHDQFAQQKPLPLNNSKTVEFHGFKPLEKALKPLTEGVTPQGQTLERFVVTAKIKQYGGYVALSDLLRFTDVDPMVLEAQETIADQAGRTLDTVTREVINAGTNVQYADGTVSSRSALAEGNVLTVKAVKIAVRALKKQNAPRINGNYVAIINPDVAYDLSEDQEYKDQIKYTDASTFKNGFLYKLSGVEFYESTEVKIFAKAGSGSRDVYSTLIVGRGAYGVTKLEGHGLETIIKQLGSAGSADPLDQRSTVGWKAAKAAAILVDQYMVRVETCSHFNDQKAN